LPPIEPSREQLLTWFELSPQGWLILDPMDRIVFLNAKAKRLLLIQTDTNPNKIIQDLLGEESLVVLLEDTRRQRQAKRIEWDNNGDELEVYAYPDQFNWVAILLQSRRSIEAQLNQQEKWVSDVSHELKTPLTALLLVADSLAATATEHNAVLVERLLKELRRMQDLVADLLELSRLENVMPGKGFAHECIELPSLIFEAWQGIMPLAEEKNIALKFDRECEHHDIPVVLGDRKRLHRALLNLFDNAVRHSPAFGTVSVNVYSNTDWLRIDIKDQGAGLSEEDLQHMFERFYRGDASRYRHHRGASGLGLAIVQQIVLTHGGLILGDNLPGGGARFEIRLPRHPVSERM
jgi:two-component system phosphate regulon sensor histidine kinase PhoR